MSQLFIRSAISYNEGRTFTYEGPVFGQISWVDPDALYLPDKKVRLYYLNNKYNTVYASDGDGRRFTGNVAVTRSVSDAIYDPTLVRIPQTKKYLMYYGIPTGGIGVMASCSTGVK